MTPGDTAVTRRGLLGSVAAVGGASLLADRATAQQNGTDWPELNVDAANTGHHERAQSFGNVSNDWTFDADGRVMRPPTVRDGTVYAGTDAGTVYAIDAAEGTEQWTFETGDSVKTSPAVYGGSVYVGSDDGNVYALDAATGDELWRVAGESWAQTSPTVVDGVVLAGNDGLFAADADTGEVLWRTDGPVDDTPAVADGRVYLAEDDEFLAYDLSTGERVWEQSLAAEGGMATTVADGRVYVPNGTGPVYAFDAETGEELWTFDGEGRFTAPVSVADGTVYAGTWDGIYLYAIDAATGEEAWSNEVSASISSAPIPAGDELIVATDELRGYDRETGEQRWSWENVGSRGGPIVVEDRCYVGDEIDGAVHALDPAPAESWPVPGFGVVSALAGLLGAGAVRRLLREGARRSRRPR